LSADDARAFATTLVGNMMLLIAPSGTPSRHVEQPGAAPSSTPTPFSVNPKPSWIG
jgi:hypothetical protein